MKNTVMVPFVFFINLLLWTVVIGFFSVFASYDGLNALTSGSAPVFFNECLYRAVYYLPMSISLALVAVFFFLMRHRTLFWITAVFVLSLIVFSLFLLMPISYRYTENNIWSFIQNRSLLTASSRRILSPDIIRPDDTGIRGVWFSVTDDEKRISPVVLVRSGSPDHALAVYQEASPGNVPGTFIIESGEEIYRATGPDPQYLPVFTPPKTLSFVYTRVAAVMDAFLRAFRGGFTHYTLFSGVFFISVLLISVICRATGWRLLNILFALAMLFYLYGVYPLFSGGSVFTFVQRLAPSGMSPELIPALLYFLQALVFSLISGFVFLRRLVRRRERGDAL